MNWRIFLTILASCFSITFAASPANAQATRTWVSGVGDDVNPCSRTAPCKTFAGAISKTAAGGEINCLDPGGYGTVTITKSLTIDCAGTLGSILSSSVQGVIINDGSTGTPGTINVILRNIAINGAGTTLGVSGIRFIRGASLSVENVRIMNHSTAGIHVNPAASLARIYVTDTVITGSTAANEAGIIMAPTGSAAVQMMLRNVEISGHFRGIDANVTGTTAGNALTIIGGSVFGNGDQGITGTSNANALTIMIHGSTIANNLYAIVLSGTGVNTRLGDSTVAQNSVAFSASGGATFQSYRNSQIDLNGNNTTPVTQAALN